MGSIMLEGQREINKRTYHCVSESETQKAIEQDAGVFYLQDSILSM